MKLVQRIITLVIVLVILFITVSPSTTQAATSNLTPGVYMGKFTYSYYNTIYDQQTSDDGNYVLTDSTIRIDIEGTLTIEVDKKGNIKSGAKIDLTGSPSNNYYQLVISDRNCNVVSYISSESRGSVKTNNSSTAGGVIKGDLNLGSANLDFFNVVGQSNDCQPLADQEFLLNGVNKVIEALNKFKTMQFLIVRASPNSISGTITIQDTPYKESTPGGFILLRENGFFLVHNVLASLDDNPSSESSSSGEWRTK